MKRLRAHPRHLTRAIKLASCERGVNIYYSEPKTGDIQPSTEVKKLEN
jgi:hypothetical protein